ncbi:hypothetical protein [Streptomyces sp. GQFP]|nr:hypothetical protein [Streptomyces sp. GQFP]UIX28874.1 hypothetical protein LUX31_01915 [Streptomyces sp. GQFP]
MRLVAGGERTDLRAGVDIVLGLELTATYAEPAWGLKKGDVMDYSAWMR